MIGVDLAKENKKILKSDKSEAMQSLSQYLTGIYNTEYEIIRKHENRYRVGGF